MNFKKVGKLNFFVRRKLYGKVFSLSESQWNEFEMRQHTWEAHQHTKTIPLMYDGQFSLNKEKSTKWYPMFEDELEHIHRKLSKYYGGGHISRCILTKLSAKKSIPPHIDTGFVLDICNRIHIPIITNSKVIFSVGSETKRLRGGSMWEINNSGQKHSVVNSSDLDRVHMVLDYVRLTSP